MDSIIETLYEALEPDLQSKAERAAMNAAETAIHQAELKLTAKEFERFWDAWMEIACVGELESFTRGFRLGVQLTLEGLHPIS